jgi:hypothetical protein
LVAVAERLFGLTQIVVALLPIVMLSGDVHAQESDGEHNHGYALLSGSRSRFPGLGVGEIQVAAGQIASDATVRLVLTESKDRIVYPAIEIVSVEPTPLPKPELGGGNRVGRDAGGRRVGEGALLNRLRGAIQRVREHIDPVEHVRIRFLFTGSEPLQLKLQGDVTRNIELRPREIESEALNEASRRIGREDDLRATDREWNVLLRNWWEGYVAQAKRQVERSDYPNLIERYLAYSLANRFGFPIPKIEDPKLSLLSNEPVPRRQSPLERPNEPTPAIALITGLEEMHDAIRQEQLTQSVAEKPQRVAVPAPPRWRQHKVPELPEGTALEAVRVEAISKVVPAECLYIRFDSFQNYLWFQQLSASRGGDIAQLVKLRGFNYETAERAERLLNTKMTTLSKLFGDAVISDMAIIGHDLYLQDGPTMGVVFEARNYGLLKTSFEQERQATLKRLESQGAKLRTELIEGTEVSFLSMPDHSVRSFMVEAEPYLFLTSSRELAKRFLQVQKTAEYLGTQPEFRFTRFLMPLDQEYDVFAYFSSQFFQNLLSPQVQIELKRRMRAIASIEHAELASMVSSMEEQRGMPVLRGENTKLDAEALANIPPGWAPGLSGRAPGLSGRAQGLSGRAQGLSGNGPGDRIDTLIRLGYLPEWFQRRVDGSETIRFNEEWHDSVRGRRGSFLPIADVPIVDCTPEESAEYRILSEYYTREWQQTDPLMFGLRRYEHPEIAKGERIAIEASIAPLGSDKYGWVGLLLAPPSDRQIQLPKDDVVSLQLHLRGNDITGDSVPNHYLFAGLKDVELPFPEETKGLIATLRLLRSLPVYLGAWPKPAMLDRLPLGLGGGPPDVIGYSRALIGLWRWQMGGFSILSFHREILEACASVVRVVPSEDVAQGRMSVRDVSASRVAGWFHTLGFRQAAQATRGNLFLLDAIESQLGVQPKDSLEVAQRLLDAKLQCTLGGTYELRDGLWQSTAWPDNLRLAPGAHASSIGFDTLHTVPPSDYRASWLEWFRGANLHLTQLPERLVVVGNLDMDSVAIKKSGDSPKEEKPEALPKLDFDIYDLPFKMFNSDKPKKNKSSEKSESESETEATKRRKF